MYPATTTGFTVFFEMGRYHCDIKLPVTKNRSRFATLLAKIPVRTYIATESPFNTVKLEIQLEIENPIGNAATTGVRYFKFIVLKITFQTILF